MTTLSDLCVVCADAPTLAQRQQADALLGQALAGRLASLQDKYDVSRFDLAAVSGGQSRAGAFAVNLAPFGGIPYPQVLGGGCAVGVQAQADPQEYEAALSVVLPQATTLIAQASAASSPGWLTASRRVVEHQRVAPGGSLPLYAFLGQVLTGDGSFSFAAGPYRIELAARIWVDSASNPATASFELQANGVDVLALSGVREAFDLSTGLLLAAGDDRRLDSTFVTMSGSLTLASSSALTLRSSGATEQRCIGILRVMPA